MNRISLLSLSLLMVFSCTLEKAERRIVASKGLPSELLLVVDDPVWDSDVADTLKDITEGCVPGLMQSEPYFRLTRISSRHYVQTYTTMHSKLFVHIDKELKAPMAGFSYDVVARPQIEVTVSAPSISSLRSYLSTHKQQIRDLIAEHQLQMRADLLRKRHSARISEELKSVLGYTICVPEQVNACKRGINFLWAGSNLNEKDLNVVVYTYPWQGDDVADVSTFTARRDSAMKENIPGGRPDQWMQTTCMENGPVVHSRQITVGGKQVAEMRGLWEMRNGALGGPFVSLVRVDTATSTVVVAEGFVYSPSTEKRELLRSVEASLRTLTKIKKK